MLCKVAVTTPITTVYNQAFLMAPIATEGDSPRSPQAGFLQGWLGSQHPNSIPTDADISISLPAGSPGVCVHCPLAQKAASGGD